MTRENKIAPSDVVVKSKVKEIIREVGMNAASDLWDALGHRVTCASSAASGGHRPMAARPFGVATISRRVLDRCSMPVSRPTKQPLTGRFVLRGPFRRPEPKKL